MRLLLHILGEALSGLQRDWRRLLPMSLGILWGMASVMVLLAIARGFEAGQRRALGVYGDRFVLLRLNRAEMNRASGGEEKRLMMDDYDIERLRRGAPSIRHLSPMNSAYRAKITSKTGVGTNTWISGSLPEITKLRSMPLAAGRFYTELDEARRSRVIVLGPMARRNLFGTRPAVGNMVRISGFSRSAVPTREEPRSTAAASRRGAAALASAVASPSAARTMRALRTVPGRSFASSPSSRRSSSGSDYDGRSEIFKVIGVLADNEVQRESYVSLARMAFIPFSTSAAVFQRKYNLIYIEPQRLEDKDLALRQFRQVMGSRYGFAADDENAVLVYFDSIARAQSIEMIFSALRVFLAAVGILILTIGALGVMNVVLVSVAARRFEIGLRKTLGATPTIIYLQFFTETVITCILSGLLGFLLGSGGIALLAAVPLPEGFSRPVLDIETAALSFGLLALVAVIVGYYPARAAARLPPIAALRDRW